MGGFPFVCGFCPRCGAPTRAKEEGATLQSAASHMIAAAGLVCRKHARETRARIRRDFMAAAISEQVTR